MAVDQLPGQVREFVAYLSDVLARLDQGGGWCAVFWQRDPDGMQACLDGREVPPWDVVESLLQDLAGAYGLDAARAEAERARPLHAAAQSAHDARPGGRDALGDRFDVMLREQRYAAERQAELGRLLAAAATQEEADALRLDLAWARDDHERAVRRCAELRSRMNELDRRTMGDRADAVRRGRVEGAGFFRRGRPADAAAYGDDEPGVGPGGRGHGHGDEWAGGHTGPAHSAGSAHSAGPVHSAGTTHSAGPTRLGAPDAGFPTLPQQRGTAVAAATEVVGTGYAAQRPDTGPASAQAAGPDATSATGLAASQGAGPTATSATGPGPAEGPHPGYGPRPTASDDASVRPGHGIPQPDSADAFDRAYAPQQTPTGTAADNRTPRTGEAQPGTPPDTLPTAKQRKRRRGGARFAGEADAEVGPVVAPPTAVPDLPAEPAKRGRTPRGARFAGAAEATDVRQPGRTRAQKASSGPEDAAAPRETADTVATLVRLRAEGRTGEAHALLVEVAHWPAARFPLLAAELQRAGLGADWATLLWEAASLPAEQLVAAADALVAAGRAADGEQMLRQGVARPAGEIGAAVLALLAEGRRREASALLDAYVRVRTPEEAARSAEPDPRTLVPLLLTAARAVSQERHWDLVHALRVAGFSA
ncbi:hypothetical protein [Streptomyces sp. 351MFTsu5.1]|uniref:hypothetical protein n=1 Tax=Streptomyces sp. 351MFTsu5.1 TaxID=1172180 RepID=UPI00036A13C8|nr:hypothetical protein [Streptomyces sp. 351MFTsu5.1]